MDNYQNIFNITHSPRFDVIVGRKRAIDGQCQCFPMFFIMFTIIVHWGTVRRRPNQHHRSELDFSLLLVARIISIHFSLFSSERAAASRKSKCRRNVSF